MYRLSIFFKHGSEERVREACDRVADYFLRARSKALTFSIQASDELNEDYQSRGYVDVSDRHFLGVIAECLSEDYCLARVMFVKKSYSPEDGIVEGNAWGVTLSGPLDDVYRIAKRLKQPKTPMEPETKVKTSSKKYSHLRLVE